MCVPFHRREDTPLSPRLPRISSVRDIGNPLYPYSSIVFKEFQCVIRSFVIIRFTNTSLVGDFRCGVRTLKRIACLLVKNPYFLILVVHGSLKDTIFVKTVT